MKRFISAALAVLMLAGTFSACGEKESSSPETSVATTTSDATVYAEWLENRLGYAPENVVLGIGSNDSYGIDLTNFENDGYVLRTIGDSTLIFGKTADGLDRAVRAYAKAVDAGTADTLNETYHEGYRIERLTIAGRDISEYTVYYPETANENMKFAADELVRLVEIATGVKLSIVVGAPVSPAIELRHTDDPALRDEGYVYTVTESGLLIEGAVKRGCSNGVWRFLQLECGWDRLIYGNSYLNESDHLDITVGTTRTETPVFSYLGTYDGWDGVSNERRIPTPEQSSYPMTHPGGHGMEANKFCGPKFQYFWEQICYTEEGNLATCYTNVRDYVAARYGSPSFSIVDIGQSDNDNYCLCETCLEVFEEEGQTNVGAVIRFVNELSELINEEFSGVHFAILAYQSAKEPPKVTMPNEYININFCYDFSCVCHPVDGSLCTNKLDYNGKNNVDYDKTVRSWCAITDNFYVRNYGLNQHLLDITLIDVIYDDIRYFRDLGVKGLLYELHSYGFGTKRLERQLVFEMNWNPDMTREQYRETFFKLLENEYGDGWVYIWEYIQEWVLAQRLAGCFCCWGWNKQYYAYAEDSLNSHFYQERFDCYMDLFDKAALAADTSKQQKKAELLSCNVIYVGCYSSYFLEYRAENTERLAGLEKRWARMLEILIENGYDIKKIPTLTADDANSVAYADTVYEQAWTYWYLRYDRLTGYPLPEDAPTIKKK